MSRVIVFGPPGTGKTTTLLNIVEKALEDGIPPEQIAFVSFTNKAATEARDRAVAKFDLDPDRFKYFRTIHSMSLGELGYTKDRVMGPDNWREVQELSKTEFSGLYDLEGRGGTLAKGDQILNALSMSRHRMLDKYEGYQFITGDISQRSYERTVDTLEAYKADTGLIDFTDMLEHAHKECQPIDIKLAIIDEAQDLSLLQWKVCEALLSNADTTYVAGDDDQAIYRWSGAAVDYFQQLDGERLVLGKTHRFGPMIHELACRIAAKIKDRVPKDWEPAGVEDNITYTTVEGSVPLSNGEPWLVLTRVNYHLTALSAKLKLAGVPHMKLGVDTVKKPDVEAIEAWDTLSAGGAISASQVRKLYDKLRGNVDVKRGHKDVSDLPDEIDFDYELLAERAGLLVPQDKPWHEVLNLDPKDISYYKSILRRGKTFEDSHLVNLCTIHAVKGGECDNVLLYTNLTKKIYNAISADRQALDDEHRVFYVGVTRARKALYLCRSNRAKYTYRIPRVCLTNSPTS